MKTITLNVNLIQLPANAQPEDVLPCPRVNFFTNTQAFSSILTPGAYTETYEVDDEGFAGLDVFAWQDNIVDISTQAPAKVKVTGEYRDQVQTSVLALSAGTYDISVSIE